MPSKVATCCVCGRDTYTTDDTPYICCDGCDPRETIATLRAENERLREALRDIAEMPSHDQDDVHRLRDKALAALNQEDTPDE